MTFPIRDLPKATVRRRDRLRDAVTGNERELVTLVGLVLLGIGLGAIWPPLGPIVPGVILVAIGLGFTLRRVG